MADCVDGQELGTSNSGRSLQSEFHTCSSLPVCASRIATWPWYGGLARANSYGAAEFLGVDDYKNVLRWADAIADYTAAIALKPDNAGPYDNRAAAYEKKGLRDQAVADYRAALTIDPALKLSQDGLTRLGATP